MAEAGADKTTARMLTEIQARLDELDGWRRSEERRRENAMREMWAERDTHWQSDMERRMKDLEDA